MGSYSLQFNNSHGFNLLRFQQRHSENPVRRHRPTGLGHNPAKVEIMVRIHVVTPFYASLGNCIVTGVSTSF